MTPGSCFGSPGRGWEEQRQEILGKQWRVRQDDHSVLCVLSLRSAATEDTCDTNVTTQAGTADTWHSAATPHADMADRYSLPTAPRHSSKHPGVEPMCLHWPRKKRKTTPEGWRAGELQHIQNKKIQGVKEEEITGKGKDVCRHTKQVVTWACPFT